jgi:hypothetical protein
MVATPRGRLIQKTQRQSSDSVKSPPMSGPSDRKIIENPA